MSPKAYLEFFQTLRPEHVSQLRNLVTDDVYFRDPFNEVRGVEHYEAVLHDMFERCENPSFLVERVVQEGPHVFVRWQFNFGSHPGICGVSELRLNEQGLVQEHIDYWDPCAQLYESVPLLGHLLRYIRKRISATTSSGKP